MSDQRRPEEGGTWLDLGPLEAIEPGRARTVDRGGRSWCVVRTPDGASVRVVDDVCPHAGAPLSGGHVEEGCLVCPLHGWMFRLGDGRCPDNEAIAVPVHPSRIDASGRVEVRITADAAE